MKTLFIIIAAVVALLTGAFVWLSSTIKTDEAGIRKRIAEFDNCDHQKLLIDCRQMLSNRLCYTSEPSYKFNTLDPNIITLDPKIAQFGTNVPDTVRSLQPEFVIIRTDSVLIAGHYHGHIRSTRIGIIAWAPEMTETGTRKYINGLWYWNGTESQQSTKENY
jgi:hypothetical protein